MFFQALDHAVRNGLAVELAMPDPRSRIRYARLLYPPGTHGNTRVEVIASGQGRSSEEALSLLQHGYLEWLANPSGIVPVRDGGLQPGSIKPCGPLDQALLNGLVVVWLGGDQQVYCETRALNGGNTHQKCFGENFTAATTNMFFATNLDFSRT